MVRTLPVAVVVVLLALSGCTSEVSEPTIASSPIASPAILVPALVPQAPASLTAESATAEGKRLADTVQGSIGSTTILHVDDQSALVAASDSKPSFYGVYRVISLDPSVNPLDTAQLLANVMEKSGWTVADVSNNSGTAVTALVSGSGATAWFALIGGDSSVAGQSVVTLQLASPDLP